MGFVKRKGTKGVKHLPADSDSIKEEYVNKVNNIIKEHNIPDSLVINSDQTGCQLVPQQGSQQVSITRLDDKRQITLLLPNTKSGALIPPQVTYPGNTDRCPPKGVTFPDNWDVTQTEYHWSNEETMIQFVDNVIIPYIDDIPLSKKSETAVAIFDVYKAHRGDKLPSQGQRHYTSVCASSLL